NGSSTFDPALLVTPVARLFRAIGDAVGPPAGRLDAAGFERAVAARTHAGHDPATSLCATGVDVLGLTGVGIMLVTGGKRRDRAGALSSAQAADGQVVANVSGSTIVSWQADAPAGTLAWQLEKSGNYSVVVHQAVGRVSVQAAVTIDDAMALLRAHAFASDR